MVGMRGGTADRQAGNQSGRVQIRSLGCAGADLRSGRALVSVGRASASR
ncbi:hypothetical protein APY03_5336 [Variovorax sp. WDL1]|nr:hypothetical protein APY03_5336 [Variovorax sp. WDL1]